MNTHAWVALPALTLAFAGSLAAQPNVPKPSIKKENVRQWTFEKAASGMYGVVDAIDEGGMTFTHIDDTPPKQYTLTPVDLLVQGKRLKSPEAAFAYLWADVKKGDTVSVRAAFDDGEQKWYCLSICIRRRPGGKLPEGQDPKKDPRYTRDSLLNEIENGKDVNDADIAAEFPPKRDPLSEAIEKPGGLPKEYQEKLDTIRAKKKEKDLKATPPDKK